MMKFRRSLRLLPWPVLLTVQDGRRPSASSQRRLLVFARAQKEIQIVVIAPAPAAARWQAGEPRKAGRSNLTQIGQL